MAEQSPFAGMVGMTDEAGLIRWINSLPDYPAVIKRLADYYHARADHARENLATSPAVVEHLERAANQALALSRMAEQWREHAIKTVIDDWMRHQAPRGGVRKEASADNRAARRDRA